MSRPDRDRTATETGTGSNRSPVDESAADELRKKRQALRRRYKIQDVIQRRQVLLVQVVKEERGNKGAALTTYLSLAGRYCVLMPNTSHGGGISRKISNGADRKRLKSIMSDLNLPKTMGLIVRTAGLSRTKVEIKRDFDYLARLWDEIREETLKSTAPALVYRDSDLIKRAIRDLYHRDIDEVIVEGEEGYQGRARVHEAADAESRQAGHAAHRIHAVVPALWRRRPAQRHVPADRPAEIGRLSGHQPDRGSGVDRHQLGPLDARAQYRADGVQHQPRGRPEIARQLRLRDMAGLVVIDFIDMEQNNHVRKVEKAMKEALKNDRARIQVGRISGFGLMEMSRQRLRTGVLEASTRPCVHCDGTGLMRTASSAGLQRLRILEDEAARGRGDKILLRAGREAAVYVLNKKRAELADIEHRYGVAIEVVIDETFEGARMTVESSGAAADRRAAGRSGASRTTTISKPEGRGRGIGRNRARGRGRSGSGRDIGRGRRPPGPPPPPPPPWRARRATPRFRRRSEPTSRWPRATRPSRAARPKPPKRARNAQAA